MSPSFLIPRCFSGLKKWPDLLSVSGKQRCNIDPAQTAWDLEKRTGGVTSILRKAFKSCILSFHPSLGAQSAHLMMSMCPFLAARCSGLVPLGSVESPGLASNRAAHMLLLSSSWTTCRANRWPYTHTEANYWQKNRKKDIKIIWHYQKKQKKKNSMWLTPTRPNSQAKSNGVFPALSTMQGFDWCCRSISDCGQVASC